MAAPHTAPRKHFPLRQASSVFVVLLALLSDSAMGGILAHGPYRMIGTLPIALCEAVLINEIFKTRRVKTYGMMIVANYASMIVGYAALGLLNMAALDWLSSIMPQNGWILIPPGIVASFLLTILLEYPFMMWALRTARVPIHNTLRACVLVQIPSYCILLPCFLLMSDFGLYGRIKFNNSLAFVRNENATLFYISAKDHNVYRRTIRSGMRDDVKVASTHGGRRRLILVRCQDSENLDLYMLQPEGNLQLLVRSVDEANEAQDIMSNTELGEARASGKIRTTVVDLRPLEQRRWRVFVNPLSERAFTLIDEEGGERMHFPLSPPYQIYGGAHCVSVLPGDEIVFEFASNICIYSRVSNRCAVVCKGKSPVVILAENSTYSWPNSTTTLREEPRLKGKTGPTRPTVTTELAGSSERQGWTAWEQSLREMTN